MFIFHVNDLEGYVVATTSCKIVETLRLKCSPPNKNAPPIIQIINKIHPPPPIQSCWLKFRIWFCIVSNFDHDHGDTVCASIRENDGLKYFCNYIVVVA